MCLYLVKNECTMKSRCRWQDKDDGNVCTVAGELSHDALTKSADRQYRTWDEPGRTEASSWE